MPPQTAQHWKPLTWLAIFLAVAPMFYWYLSDLWQVEHYQFFPFVGVFLAVVFYQRWDRHLAGPRGWFAYSLLGLAAVASLVGIKAASPWLIALAIVLALGAFFISQWDRDGYRMTYLWPVCWLVLRLPMNRDDRLIHCMQRVTTELSSVVLSFLNVPHIARGAIIDLPTRELFVAEACSGIKSLFTILFVAIAMLAWHHRRMLLLPLYIVAASLLAMLVNVLRISSIAVAEHYWQWDVSTGWVHDALGYAALLIAILLLFSADTLLYELFAPIPEKIVDEEECQTKSVWNWLTFGQRPQEPIADQDVRIDWTRTQVTCLALCGMLGVLSTWQTIQRPDELITMPTGRPPVLLEPNREQIEAAIAPLPCGGYTVTRDREDPRLGIHSDLWSVQIESHVAEVVISQPYNGWKELSQCYLANGWRMVDHQVIQPPSQATTGEQKPISVARFRNHDGRHGLLCYAAVSHRGEHVSPVPLDFVGATLSRMQQAFSSSANGGQTITIQCWLVSQDPLDDKILREILRLIGSVRTSVQTQMKAHHSESSP